MLLTSDPATLHHIMSSNFSNYPKGPDTKLLFEAYGEILFATDLEEWRKQRKIVHGFFDHHEMRISTPKINHEIIQNGLFPVLDQVSEQGLVADLQEIIKRFMLDATCMIATGYNHGSLRVGLPEDRVLTALHDINHGILIRHIFPERLWKAKKWLGIGAEKKLCQAWETLDSIALEYLHKRKENPELFFQGINYFSPEFEAIGLNPSKVMIDVVKSLLFGGTDTPSSALTWFFWLVLENPKVELKIRGEIEANLSTEKGEKRVFFDPDELNKLVYLHATLLESMRLYPPAPFQSRTSIESDILPSGHRVNPMMKIVPCCYAMGRMESIWGEDCLEFKPERWISEKGRIIPVPSNKFVAFSSGPRICPGKELGLIRLKAAAASIIHNYQVEILKNHPVIPTTSIILNMKHGLKVRVTNRSA
ncbi:hypothetical protein ACH5RR_012451 [Cinchona calisaya]|uniref:Cytochrome P450 n=1 Tax=Cinchona calisaya TaxID=153742 RepID=A0ABD3A7N9_9GENT